MASVNKTQKTTELLIDTKPGNLMPFHNGITNDVKPAFIFEDVILPMTAWLTASRSFMLVVNSMLEIQKSLLPEKLKQNKSQNINHEYEFH